MTTTETTKTVAEAAKDFLAGCNTLSAALIATGRWGYAAGANRWQIANLATGKLVPITEAYETEMGWRQWAAGRSS